MKKVKIINVNESGLIGLSTANAMQWESISAVRLCILSDLYYFNPKIREKSENDQFQWKWVYGIKHVKCYGIRIHRSCPIVDFKWSILFNPNIHENSENDQYMKVGLSD